MPPAHRGWMERRTVLLQSIKEHLREHLRRVKMVRDEDLADRHGRVLMPDALDRWYSNAFANWRWQWLSMASLALAMSAPINES